MSTPLMTSKTSGVPVWLRPCLRYLLVGVFAVAPQGVALGIKAVQTNPDQERERRTQENSFGSPKAEPLSEAVTRFNQEAGELAAKWDTLPAQPPLTDREVVSALRWAIETGNDRGPDFLAKCRSVVATSMLPKGSKFMLNRGTSRKAHRPDGMTPPGIAMWHIVLFFSIDQVPMQVSKEMVVVRLVFLDSRQ